MDHGCDRCVLHTCCIGPGPNCGKQWGIPPLFLKEITKWKKE